MKRPRTQFNYSFEAGQADPIYERRAESELWIKSAKALQNVRLDNGGGAHRRPGLARRVSTAGPVRFREFVGRTGTQRMLAFRSGAVDVYESDYSIEQTVTGAAWASDDLATLQFAQENDRVFIASQSFFPQQLVRASDGTWSAADIDFDGLSDGSTAQPYYRFSDTRDITITPSATSGAGVTLTASAAVFDADHVGVIFRLLGREVEVTAYTNTTHVTVTVLQELFPTRRWTVGSTSGFSVGDSVQTSVDSVEAVVTQIVSATVLEVIQTNTFSAPTMTSNNVVGPTAASAISGDAAAPAPAATVQWDEQMISPVRGYPGVCAVHRSRLFFADFPQAPEVLAASSVGLYANFDLGTAQDADAFIECIGDAVGRRIRHLQTAEQLIVLTEVGAYYAGEGPNTPLTPTTVDFQKIGPEPASASNPIFAAEGVIYMDGQGDRVMRLEPSGNVRRTWGATEIADLSPDLFSTPTRLLLVDGSDWGPERYIIAVNDDGTLGVMLYRRNADVVGTTPWDTPDGQFVDVALFSKEVWACVLRGAAYTIETFSTDRLLDCSTLISNVSPAAPTHASWASLDIALVWRETASGEERRVDVGEFTADVTGALTSASTASRDYEGGFRFDVDITLWPPIDPMEGPASHQRIARAAVDVKDSGLFYAGGRQFTPYRASDDVTAPPPLRTGWRKGRLLGRKRDYNFTVTQTEAAPLHVRAISMDVT